MTVSSSGTRGCSSPSQSKDAGHHDGARHVRGAVALLPDEGVSRHVRVDALAPADLALDRPGVRIEQQLVRIAAHASRGIPGAVDAVAVALAGADAGQVAVPGVAGSLGQIDARLVSGLVEEAQLHPLGHAGEDREAGARPRRRARPAGRVRPRVRAAARTGRVRGRACVWRWTPRARGGTASTAAASPWVDGGRHWTRTSDLLHVKQVL